MSVLWTPLRLAMEENERKEPIKRELNSTKKISIPEVFTEEKSLVVGWTNVPNRESGVCRLETPRGQEGVLKEEERLVRSDADWKLEWLGRGRDSGLRWSTSSRGLLQQSDPLVSGDVNLKQTQKTSTPNSSHRLKSTFTTVALLENSRHLEEVQSEKGLKVRSCNGSRTSVWRRSVGLQCELLSQPSHVSLPPETKEEEPSQDMVDDCSIVAAPEAAPCSKSDTKQGKEETPDKQDDSCFVDCLFYTMQCCDCTIL